MSPAPESTRVITVSVRALVDFVLRTGDLGGEAAFSSPSRARAGIRGHQRLQKERPAGYEKEVPIVSEIPGEGFLFRIQGRMDGVLREPGRVLIEEIKTTAGRIMEERDPIHWAQLKLYAAMCARQQSGEAIRIQLTYFELESGEVTQFAEDVDRPGLEAFFDEVTQPYLAWAAGVDRWRLARDASIQQLTFPYSKYRPGQRQLAVTVYRSLAAGRKLFAEAPTGIGKTISVLFPAIKALGEGRFVRLFYLTSKTMGRTVAEKALEDLRAAGLRLRSITLTAKEKICFNQGQPCDPRTCPYAVGYFDRIKRAVADALTRDALNRGAIEELGRQHQVCPFELSLDASLWVDVIIGDYNYAFDPAASLKRFFAEDPEDCAFLVDEAHNLVDRARDMFSAELRKTPLRELQKTLKEPLPDCARALERVIRAFNTTWRATRLTSGTEAAPEEEATLPALESMETPVAAATDITVLVCKEGQVVLKGLPDEWLNRLRQFAHKAEAWLMFNRPAPWREELLGLYFETAAFLRIAELYDDRFVTILEAAGRELRVRLFCLDPSEQLRRVLERARATVFFSATLSPMEYFRDLLGGEPADPTLRLDSPFPPEHLRLLIHDGISTRYRDRAATYDTVACAIATAAHAHRGNYLVYFPSYEYMRAVHERFAQLDSDYEMLLQTSDMDEAAREAFLASFQTNAAPRIGFAVMGGFFGEGIDLAGDRLIGAIIVGVGLPQLCLERDLIRDYFTARGLDGFDYAYTFPGMNRVLQAAGRVIRSETDRGMVLLIDTRFSQTRYRDLRPPWWQPVLVRKEDVLARLLAEFWSGTGPAFDNTAKP